MKLFLGSIFAFILVLCTSIPDYLNNNLGNEVKENSPYALSLDDSNTHLTPYQNQVHHIFGVDFEEKNEKFKKLYFAPSGDLFKSKSNLIASKQVNAKYFAQLITPSVSKYILLETFRI